MDIFTTLLKEEAWQWGLAAFLILLLLYTTDIPPSILNFFIRILKLKTIESNPQEQYWSKLPTYYRKIPVAGFMENLISRKKLQEYIEHFIENKQSGMSLLYKKLYYDNEVNNKSLYSNENVINYTKFKSRNSVKITQSPITILNGLPGTGKSTFILNHIENERRKGKVDFVIYFPFSDFSSKYNSLNNLQDKDLEENFWNDIYSSTIYAGVSEYKKPSSNLLSYYINYRYCYIIIDDVIGKPKLETFVDGLYRYRSTCHRRNKKLKIIITTRERDLHNIESKGYSRTVTLKPLTEEDARIFFYEKCKQLNIDLRQQDFFDTVDKRVSLLRFENEFTQNPLFVEIVVSMIKEKGFKTLSETFQKSVGAVYKEFTKILFERNVNTASYQQFYTSYRELAYNVTKTNSKDITNEKIKDAFTGTTFNEDFLYANALLIRKLESGQFRYSFIHKTLSDILYIEEIIKINNYSDFSNVDNIGGEYTFYLKEQILLESEYLSLMKANISIAGNLLDDGFLQKIARVNINITSVSIMDSAINEYILNPGNFIEEGALLTLYNKLSGKILDKKNYLLSKVNTNNCNINQKIIRLYIAFNTPELNNFFLTKMVNNENASDFAELLNAGYEPLLNLIKSRLGKAELNTSFQNKLLLFLLSPKISTDSNKRYATWFLGNINLFLDSTLQMLLTNEYIRTKIVLRYYEHKDMVATKKLNKILFHFTADKVFIPKGNYMINGNTVNNPESILVSKKPISILVRANNNYKAQMEALNAVQTQLLTFDQLQIASSLFAKEWPGDLLGIVPLSDQTIINQGILYECYKLNNKGELRFAFKESMGLALMKVNKNTSYSKNFIENIIYRSISFCN